MADEMTQHEYSNNRYYAPLYFLYIYIKKKNSYNFLWFGNKNIKLNFRDQNLWMNLYNVKTLQKPNKMHYLRLVPCVYNMVVVILICIRERERESNQRIRKKKKKKEAQIYMCNRKPKYLLKPKSIVWALDKYIPCKSLCNSNSQSWEKYS